MTQFTPSSTIPLKPRLDKYGYNCIARHISLVVFTCAPLFIGAGTLNWDWGWLFTFMTLIGWVLLSLILARENPELLNERGKRIKDMSGSKRWDWVILTIYAVLLVVTPLIAGLDYRYGWTTSMPNSIKVIGLVVLMLSFIPLTWSMAVNRFFEGTVRIQNNRAHQVISSGPYRYVRHPGYIAVILQFIAIPLALGSWSAAIPAALGVVLFVVRTWLEDRTLIAELRGYAEFANHTHYRLLPYVW